MALRSIAALVVTAAVALSAAPAAAQTPSFAYATDKDREELAKVPTVEWKASAQAGLMLTTGNSRITAVSGGLVASRKSGMNKLQLDAGLAYARSSVFVGADADGDGVLSEDEVERDATTTNNGWNGKARYDRFLTTNDSLFAAALAAADKPAGKEFVGGGQLGYSRQLYKDDRHAVVAEVGYDFSYEDPTVGDGAGIHSGRVFAGYSGKVGAETGLEASVETLLNVNRYDTAAGEVDPFGDTRVNGKLAITTKLLEDLSFRAGFESRYDHAPSPRPPFAGLAYAPGYVPLADELDTKVEAALILNFL
jgi:hypothetical protein